MALCKAKDERPEYKRILEAAKVLVFLGAPHRGLETEALEQMITGLKLPSEGRSKTLVQSLSKGSVYLNGHLQNLRGLWAGRKILSLYETVTTPTVKIVGILKAAKVMYTY